MRSPISERVRFIARSCGGNAAPSNQTGIPLGTLNNYIAGRGLPFAVAILLTKASGLSLEWLASGEPSETKTTNFDQSIARDIALAPPPVEEPKNEGLLGYLPPEQRAQFLNSVITLALTTGKDAEIGPFIRGYFEALIANAQQTTPAGTR